jgi:hypothetical protein
MLSGTTIRNRKNGKTKQLDDGIEQVFNDPTTLELLNRLFEEKCPIKFYHLNLLGIKHPDNLYIKMNARGEQLTGFENFKADLVGFLSKKNKLKEYVVLGGDKYILGKWDVDWTDLFWRCKGKADSVDNQFFTFIKRLLLNRYIVEDKETEGNSEAVYKMLYDNEQKEYTSFELYEELMDKGFIDELVKVLDSAPNVVLDSAPNVKFNVPLLENQGYK